ncbi:MAG: sulfatase-like hydrolase/transferase [bacterium]|nr:sulfatase-like hydrolase/transferase [bacterium]
MAFIVSFISCFLTLCFVSTGCGGGGSPGVKDERAGKPLNLERKKYNVLLITLDTFRLDRLSVYSDKHVKTPNIDRLASKSFVFDRAFAHNPVTLPSHTNIHTGTTPRYHGVSDNTGFRLEGRFLTIAEHLKSQGYRTGAFVASFPLDSRFGLSQGFDEYDDNYGTHNSMELFFVERPAPKVIEPAIQWLSRQQEDPGQPGKQAENPWFAWVHLFDAHQAYLPPAPFNRQYSHDLYSGEAAYIDASLKRLFDFLETRQLMDHTLIVLTADHGEALGEKGEETHSYFAYNNTIHIPLLLYVPGGRPQRVPRNVCHVDIFPTLCDLLAIDTPSHLQGESLLPIIGGKKRKRDIYFESLTPYLNRGWAPLRGFVRGDVKFIDSPITEVYDIQGDPHENTNIAASSNTSNVKQYKRDLVKLKLDLKGKHMMERSKQVDSQVRNKLKSLGYLSGTNSSAPKTFTKADDLKTMLPLQNRMLAAVGEFQNGHHARAIAQLKQVVSQSPAFVLVYRHIATIYRDMGKIKDAVDILETGLKENPGNISLMSKLGMMLAEDRQLDKSVELLKLCIQKESFDPEHYNFLGVTYYKKGDFNSALAQYRKALELDNNYASVFNNIGSLYLVVYLRQKDERAYQQALSNFNRALEIDPRLFAAYNSRGAAYKFKKQITQAIADWKKTIELNPRFIDAYFNLGIAYLETGEKASALAILKQCKDRFESQLPDRDRQRLARLLQAAQR